MKILDLIKNLIHCNNFLSPFHTTDKKFIIQPFESILPAKYIYYPSPSSLFREYEKNLSGPTILTAIFLFLSIAYAYYIYFGHYPFIVPFFPSPPKFDSCELQFNKVKIMSSSIKKKKRKIENSNPQYVRNYFILSMGKVCFFFSF